MEDWKATAQRQNELSMYIVELWDRRQSDNFELLCNKCDLQLNLAATYSIPLHHYNINTTLTSWWHTHTQRENFGWWWGTQIKWFTATSPQLYIIRGWQNTNQYDRNKTFIETLLWDYNQLFLGNCLTKVSFFVIFYNDEWK